MISMRIQGRFFYGILTLNVELGALIEDTSTLSTGTGTDQVGEEAASKAGVDIGGVTGVGGLVAAGKLSLVTALGLSLLDGHAVRNVPADVATLCLEAVGAGLVGKSSSQGGEGEGDSGQRELHFEGGRWN